MLLDRRGETGVLLVADGTHRGVAGSIVGVAPGKLEAARTQEGVDAVVAADAVDVHAVVGVGELRSRRARCVSCEELVEDVLPCREVHRCGLGEYPVGVEDDRFELLHVDCPPPFDSTAAV